jgi:hypothetical protein
MEAQPIAFIAPSHLTGATRAIVSTINRHRIDKRLLWKVKANDINP